MQESGKSTLANGDKLRKQETAVTSSEQPTLQQLCARLHEEISKFLHEEHEEEALKSVQNQLRTSLDVFGKALRTYSLSQLCFSYNGGKDCLVLLIVYLAAIHEHFHPTSRFPPSSQNAPNSQPFPTSLRSIYIVSRDPFTQVNEFVDTSSEYYQLDLYSSSKPMKQAFEEYLEKHKEVKAIFVGTRRTDPHGAALSHFNPTDHGWPDFTRIHPVIDWQYRDIWTFIRHFEIPYCPLYDAGYTSLGGQSDTAPNPSLRSDASETAKDMAGASMYRPAYELIESEDERLGRNR